MYSQLGKNGKILTIQLRTHNTVTTRFKGKNLGIRWWDIYTESVTQWPSSSKVS